MQISERTRLIRQLDSLISRKVRQSESKCVTCGKRLTYKQRQAGHYIPSEVLSTRWSHKNVHCQCQKCNVELGGNLAKYKKWMDKNLPAEDVAFLEGEYENYKKGRPTIVTVEEMKMVLDLLSADK